MYIRTPSSTTSISAVASSNVEDDRASQTSQQQPTITMQRDIQKRPASLSSSKISVFVTAHSSVINADDFTKKKGKKRKKSVYSEHISSFNFETFKDDINVELSGQEHDHFQSSRGSTTSLFRFLNSFPDDPEFEHFVQLAETAIDQGIFPERIAAGSSGSYFVKSPSKKTIAVFKPRDEEPYGPANPKWGKYFQRNCCPCCFGRAGLPLNCGYISEAGASLIDECFRLDIVPKTKVIILSSAAFNYVKKKNPAAKMSKQVSKRLSFFKNYEELPPKIGSFQLFVHNYQSARVMLDQFKQNPLPSETENKFCILFQKMTVLDYIIRNTDRGHENWLLKYDEGAKQVFLAAIDNGLAFPFKHPDEWRKYPFTWAVQPRAKLPYSQEVIDLILPALVDAEFMKTVIENMFRLFRLDKHFQHHLFENQIAVMRGQIANLTTALMEGMSPAELVALPPFMVETKVDQKGCLENLVNAKRRRSKKPCFSCC